LEDVVLKTHGCGTLRASNAGESVTLAGWVHRRRDHGQLIFIDLRDRDGIVQVVVRPDDHPDAYNAANEVRGEYVLRVTGEVVERSEATRNPNIATGDIDVAVAGGMESLSNAPYLLPKAREGARMGHVDAHDAMMHDGTYYRIDPEVPFYFDVFEFIEALMLGRYGEPDDPFEVWQRVANLYRGPFLQGHNDQWILERREAYQIAYIEALENTAAYWAQDGKHELALHTLTRALDTDYANEAIHKKLLRLYVHLGRRAEAVTHYRALEKWAKSAKTSLSGEIQQVFSDIIA